MATTNETESTLHFWILSANWAKQRKKRETKKSEFVASPTILLEETMLPIAFRYSVFCFIRPQILCFIRFPLNIFFLWENCLLLLQHWITTHTYIHTLFKCYRKRRRRRKTRLQLFRKRHTKIVDSLFFFVCFSSSSQINARIRVLKNY